MLGLSWAQAAVGCTYECTCVCALLQQDIRFRTQTDFDTGPHTVAKKAGRQTQNEAAQSRRGKCGKTIFLSLFCHLNKVQFYLGKSKQLFIQAKRLMLMVYGIHMYNTYL